MGYLLGLLAGLGFLYKGLCDVTDPCPFWSEGFHVDGQCYKVFKENLFYKEAQDYCEQQGPGGRLPEILTQQQYDKMLVILRTLNDTKATTFWVGAKYNSLISTFEWVKSGKRFNSSLWLKNEPNNYTRDEDCVMFQKDGFFDIGCAAAQYARVLVCQRAVRPVTNPCYFWDGATYVNGKCFKSFNRPSTWSEALEFCRSQKPGGTLAEVFTVQERNVLSNMVQKMGSDGVWLGYSDTMTENTFLWSSINSSEPVPDVTWWVTGHPHNDHSKDCVTLNSDKPGKLDILDCTVVKNVTCQRTVNNPCALLMTERAEYFQGRCFLFVNNKENCYEAQSKCQLLSGYLTEPTSTELQDYVFDLASRNTAEYVLVGGYGKNGELRWQFTGDIVKNATTSGADNCWLQIRGQHRDWACLVGSIERTSICERDIGDPCETYLPGAVYGFGQCFRYFDDPKSWESAQEFCVQQGGFLAEPKTRELSDVVNTYLQTLQASTAWIGGANVDENMLQWVTNGQSLNYSLLNDTLSSDHDDGYLVLRNGDHWTIEGKDAVHPFVCQRGVQIGFNTYRTVTALFPKLQNVNNWEGYVQISGPALSYMVALKITVFIGLYSSYIQVISSSAVTAILYIMSSNHLAASTLLLPSDMLQRYDTRFSNFLVSMCKENCAGNVVATATLGPSEVSILLPMFSNGHRQISVGNFTYRGQFMTMAATTTSQLGSVYFKNYVDYDGSYLSSKDNIVVFIGGFGSSTKDEIDDFSLDQVLPVQFIAKEYITFPSGEPDLRDFVKVVAVESNTQIQIQESHLDIDNRRFQLDKPGDVVEIPLRNGGFYLLTGNAAFYAFRFSKNSKGMPMCLTSLHPYNLWRHEYSFQVPSQLTGYSIMIIVIVSRQYTSNITIGDYEFVKSCSDIQGTELVGCIYTFPWNCRTFFHLHLGNFYERLGAYMIASSASSLLCHSLGTRDNPQPTYTFNSDRHLLSFNDTPECDIPTTTTSCDTTTESVEISSAGDHDPATTSGSLNPTTWTSPLTARFPHSGSNSDIFYVDAKETSAYRRTKISVPDNRVSSVTIGSVGIICLVVAFASVVIGDVIRFCKFVDDLLQQRKTQYFS